MSNYATPGAINLKGLQDVSVSTPSNGQVLKFNGSTGKWANAADSVGTGPVWGGVTGTLSAQTDLQNALNAKMGTWVTPPAAADSTGTAGQLAYDATGLYVCIATDTWVKATLATWA